MRNLCLTLALSASLIGLAPQASAATVVVDALANSSSGGSGVFSGLNLTLGQIFNISVSPTDLWNAGPLPRWSNADGLTQNLYATGTDESGEAAGTLIGQNFGTYTQGNLTAPYGALVGEIGGVFQLLGTSFTGPAWASGNLNLLYWDSNNNDNTQSVSATALVNVSSAVPEPGTWALMLAGFALVGFALRRRERHVVSYSF